MKCSNISSHTILVLRLLNILADENVYEKKYMGKKILEFDIWLDLLCVRPFMPFMPFVHLFADEHMMLFVHVI